MSLVNLLTHSCSITRQGTRTSTSGETVASGVWDQGIVTGRACFAQQLSGGTDTQQQRERFTTRWRVILDADDCPAILPRDRVSVTIAGRSHVLTVLESRPVSHPGRVHHVRLDCEEVVG